MKEETKKKMLILGESFTERIKGCIEKALSNSVFGEGKTSTLPSLYFELIESEISLDKSFIEFSNRFHETFKEAQESTNKQTDKEVRKQELSTDGKKIGDRVYNQRPREEHVCELLSDDSVGILLGEINDKFMKGARDLKKNISIFAVTLFEIGDIQEAERKSERNFTDEYGKLAHLHRLVEKMYGKIIGFGIRVLQRGVAWLKSKIGEDRGREYEKHELWLELKQEMEDYLAVRIPQLVAPI